MRRRTALRHLGAMGGIALLTGCATTSYDGTSRDDPEPVVRTSAKEPKTPENNCPGGVLLVYDHVIDGEPLTVELTIGDPPPQLKVKRPDTGIAGDSRVLSGSLVYESSHELIPGEIEYVDLRVDEPGRHWMEYRISPLGGGGGGDVTVTDGGMLRRAVTIRITKGGFAETVCESDATPRPVVTRTREPNRTTTQ